MRTKLLIVENRLIEANNLKIILTKAGYNVCRLAHSAPEALAIIDEEKPEMVLLDIFLDGPKNGVDLARILSENDVAFVYLSANSNKPALDAAKATNPYGFLVKPFRKKDVLVMLEVALFIRRQKLESIVKTGKEGIQAFTQPPAFNSIIGKSKKLLDVLEQVKQIAASDNTVLIMGESGTGKELIAKAIHQASLRSGMPLIIVNCAALPAKLVEYELYGSENVPFIDRDTERMGKFEQANGATIFLDEIGELPLHLQATFLRVLQNREIKPMGGKRKQVDVRVVAATNRNLEAEVTAGRFRIDLYYRLNVFPILLSPLRDRKEDIVDLAGYFIERFAKREHKTITGLADEAVQTLLRYSWPGNIRELENLMERSVLLTNGHIISASTLPISRHGHPPEPPNLFKTIEENERDHITGALEICNWEVTGTGGAAATLGISPNQLYSRMKKLGIEKKA